MLFSYDFSYVCVFICYVFVIFTSKYFYLLFVCFIHVFSLELVYGRSLKLVGLMKEAFQAKGCKLGVFTSRQPLHESSPILAVSSRQPFKSRHLPFSVKSCNFSALSSFRILAITSSTDIKIR